MDAETWREAARLPNPPESISTAMAISARTFDDALAKIEGKP